MEQIQACLIKLSVDILPAMSNCLQHEPILSEINEFCESAALDVELFCDRKCSKVIWSTEIYLPEIV